ncbi:IS6 family transposase [Candidatus Acetothermia bacterium]|nr:IS6 family transposase [Candidatus Acetothermia bacterium]
MSKSEFTPVYFYRLGRLFRQHHPLLQRERTASWAVLLALVLYHLGLSLRRTAQVLQPFGVLVSHVAVWYWIQKLGQRLETNLESLPPCIVLDETWIKVGGRETWIFTAFDPQTWRIVYLEPFFRRNERTVSDFLHHLAHRYGQWPKQVITDGGGWYRALMPLLAYRKKFRWRIVRGGVRSAIEGFYGEFLKRRVKDFDKYFPSHRGLRSLQNWLGAYTWLHNEVWWNHYLLI